MYKRPQLSVLPQQIWKGTVPLLHDTFKEASRVQFSCRHQAEAAAATPSLGNDKKGHLGHNVPLKKVYLFKYSGYDLIVYAYLE